LFAFDSHHARHVTEQVGEEADVYPVLGNVEGAVPQLIER
jgi:hypothetical protein